MPASSIVAMISLEASESSKAPTSEGWSHLGLNPLGVFG